MTYEEIQQAVYDACSMLKSKEEWLEFKKKIYDEIDKLTADEQEGLIDSGVTEMLSMICSAFD